MSAVTTEEGDNSDFTDATPFGVLEIHINKSAPAADFFKPGKIYDLDFSEA